MKFNESLAAVVAEIERCYPDMPKHTRYYFNIMRAQDFINADDRTRIVAGFIKSSGGWSNKHALLLKLKLRSLV